MRDAYDELLAVGDGRKKKKPTPKPQRREELEDDFYDDIEEEEEKMSKAPIIHRSSWINCIHAAEIIN